jgi:sigma-B regulation protein RsbU (phosphoserine phosphatase)
VSRVADVPAERPFDAVLGAIIHAAVGASGAGRGWLLHPDGSTDLRVVAAAGDRPGDALGLRVPAERGSAGFVVASGQPFAAAIRPGADDRFTVAVALAIGVTPTSVLCVPCGTEEGVFGALEVIDKQGGGSFSIDDIELVTLLGGIAGAALASFDDAGEVASPEELVAELRHVAADDPARYASMATLIRSLLAIG